MAGTEFFISIDVETAGPFPGRYSLLAIGACTLNMPPDTFYVEIKPVNDHCLPKALQVSGLSMEQLRQQGLDPQEAMSRFEAWLKEVVPTGARPVFVALNAPFDWMFVNEYFFRYLGHNPFGHSALDIKAYYMGLKGVPWSKTAMSSIGPLYLGRGQLSHHALNDALDQAEIFKLLLGESGLLD